MSESGGRKVGYDGIYREIVRERLCRVLLQIGMILNLNLIFILLIEFMFTDIYPPFLFIRITKRFDSYFIFKK